MAIQTGPPLESPEETKENERVSNNLRKLVRAAETFHSSASTVIEGSRSTVWGGSELGDPLSDEQMDNIKNWIPPPTIPEEREDDSTFSGSRGLSASSTRDTEADQSSDSDSEIDRDLTKKFHEIAVASLEVRDYAKAESFLRQIIARNKTKGSDNDDEIVKVKIMLAYSCGNQNKWEAVEDVIAPVAMAKGKANIMAIHGLHAVAIARQQHNDYDTAIRYCKRALLGKRRVLGREDSSTHESMALLAQLYDQKGNSMEAEGCRGFLPSGFDQNVRRQPLDYMRVHLSKFIVPNGESPLKEPSQSVLPIGVVASSASLPSQGISVTDSPVPSQRSDSASSRTSSYPASDQTTTYSPAQRGPYTPPVQLVHGPPPPQQYPYFHASSGSVPQTYTTPAYYSTQSAVGQQQRGYPGGIYPQVANSPTAYPQTASTPVYPLVQPTYGTSGMTNSNYSTPTQASSTAWPLPVQSNTYPFSSASSSGYTAAQLSAGVSSLTLSNSPVSADDLRPGTKLIVGVDFGETYTAVGFAFINNTEAKEDIVTEWPGAGNKPMSKVRTPSSKIWSSSNTSRYRPCFTTTKI